MSEQISNSKPDLLLPGLILGILLGIVITVLVGYMSASPEKAAAADVTTKAEPLECDAPNGVYDIETARMLWWFASKQYRILMERSEPDATTGWVSTKELYIDPCKSSEGRLSTILHEAGHVLQPTSIAYEALPSQQTFADAVARDAWSKAKIIHVIVLPTRNYGKLVAEIETKWASEIDAAGSILAKVIRP